MLYGFGSCLKLNYTWSRTLMNSMYLGSVQRRKDFPQYIIGAAVMMKMQLNAPTSHITAATF